MFLFLLNSTHLCRRITFFSSFKVPWSGRSASTRICGNAEGTDLILLDPESQHSTREIIPMAKDVDMDYDELESDYGEAEIWDEYEEDEATGFSIK